MGKVIFTTALCLSAMTQMMAQNITGKGNYSAIV